MTETSDCIKKNTAQLYLLSVSFRNNDHSGFPFAHQCRQHRWICIIRRYSSVQLPGRALIVQLTLLLDFHEPQETEELSDVVLKVCTLLKGSLPCESETLL